MRLKKMLYRIAIVYMVYYLFVLFNYIDHQGKERQKKEDYKFHPYTQEDYARAKEKISSFFTLKK